MKESDRQSEKEEAVLLALQNSKALIRRGLEIHTIDKEGNTLKLSESKDYESLWKDALEKLKND